MSVVALFAISRVDWPAFPSSNQLHALTTVGQVACLLALVGMALLWRRGWAITAQLGAAAFLSAFTVVTLGMPLGATKLYLFGVSVDQQFRTEYLTRLTDSPALRDMTYAGLPPFYPPGWFWIGGRVADAAGMPAWEMFKPWAITSIAVAVVIAMLLWAASDPLRTRVGRHHGHSGRRAGLRLGRALQRHDHLLAPPILVLAWSGLRGGTRSGGWAAIAGVGIFLGIAATFYTLLLGYTAFTVAAMAFVVAAARRSLEPLLRLAVVAGISAAIGDRLAAVPAASRARTGQRHRHRPALPAGRQCGADLPDAAVHPARGIVHARHGVAGVAGTDIHPGGRPRYRGARGVRVVAAVDAHHTCRHHAVVLQAAARADRAPGRGRRLRIHRCGGGAGGAASRRVIPVLAAMGLISAIGFSQDIPDVLRPDLNVAYTDTDGDGQRGDRRPPGSGEFYPEIDAAIRQATGDVRNRTVVLTADYSFLAYYPYFGFRDSHRTTPTRLPNSRSAPRRSRAGRT